MIKIRPINPYLNLNRFSKDKTYNSVSKSEPKFGKDKTYNFVPKSEPKLGKDKTFLSVSSLLELMLVTATEQDSLCLK